MRAKYVNVSIPEELAKKVDRYMKDSRSGYRSRAEVVAEALRTLMNK
jgi:metal-responsive CopG/Arc/MetJ family transcriptional regulator